MTDYQEEGPFGFGMRLRHARTREGLSQAELAELIGVNSRQSICDWEKEYHYPKVDQLREICRRLGVSPDYLVFGGMYAFMGKRGEQA